MVKECGRTKDEGGVCHAVALRGKSFCYFHDPRRRRAAKAMQARYFLEVPLLEHSGAIRAAINEVVRALAAGEIDHQLGGRLLYSLQLAMNQTRLGSPLVKQASPRILRIAPMPGFTKIYTTRFQPAPETPAPETLETSVLDRSVRAGAAPLPSRVPDLQVHDLQVHDLQVEL